MDAGVRGVRDRSAQKRRTRRAILDAAVTLLRQGVTPTAATVAELADVSRRTVYQYFPNQEKLLTDAALEVVRTRVDDALDLAPCDDVEARLDALVSETLRSCIDNEVLLHAMVRLSTQQRLAVLRDGRSPTAPLRGVRRIEWIEAALLPVRAQFDDARYERLVSALAVCIGFEALLVLRDIRGLNLPEMEAVSRWMARALLRAALATNG